MSETITNVHTYDQPLETSVKVGIEIDSKGQRKPSIELKIARKLQDATIASDVMETDIKEALEQCKNAIKSALEVTP